MSYNSPELDLVLLGAENDIISTSGEGQGGNSDTETPDDNLWG